jgi:RNA 2',3'-cyclic 3'-phosphodiesterase
VAAPGSERTARLFFALWPDEAMQAQLARTLSALVRSDAPVEGRAVPQKNFHLTVAFLGTVAQSRFESLFEVAARCAQTFRPASVPIVITLDTLEHWRKPQVLVATSAQTPPAAVALAEALKGALVEQGFSPDLKPFRVHATVARKVRRVTGELHIEPVRWRFDSLHLIESRSGTYSTVKKWILDKRD